MSTKYKIISIASLCSVFLLSFQNCSDFGPFSANYSQLSSMDPHKDSWRPVDGLVVENGEWKKVEQQVTHKARTTDRNFIASALYRAFLPIDESKWSNSANKPIRELIDSYVQKNYRDFGGPCFYTNPERTVGTTRVNCYGTTAEQMDSPVIPGSNVFKSSLKVRLCDKLLQNDKALNNFKMNAQKLADLFETNDMLYAAHQVFYLGNNPRKRTFASLENLYNTAIEAESGMEKEGLRHVALALCSSVGWETP